jgi:hypothetical protein
MTTTKRAARTSPQAIGDAKAIAKSRTASAGGKTWMPRIKGDAIGGKVLSVGEEQGKFGAQVTLLIDAGTAGVFKVYANAWMQHGIDRANIKAGDRIGITYQGDVPTGRGRPSRSFSVAKL